ncbi:MAG: bifunctional UDP-N-acetylglucosamine diphosphorylase/glucosamine-1-phosphate N-acetyltransferase GlmU [Pseudomonadota bacterium]
MNNKLEVAILAAGKGTRMNSKLPKVLHTIGGCSLVGHVIKKAKQLNCEKIHLVYGFGGEILKANIDEELICWAEQQQQLGTAHAVQQIQENINPANDILILYGDVPLTSTETLEQLIAVKENSNLAILTAQLRDSTGYGRIVRNEQGQIQKIVEEKDASDEIKQIREINTGIMLISGKKLIQWLAQINNNNAQQEYYLTDIVELAVKDQEDIAAYICENEMEIQGINDKSQLATLECEYQRQQVDILLTNGVTLRDPERVDIRGELTTAMDNEIDVNVIFEGKCSLGDNVKIGANSIIKNSTIADNVTILENCIIENSIINESCTIGPFARLRPETIMEKGSKAGNFVEIKKSTIGAGSKVSHLSYIGDTQMGKNVNVGAGTITCNYDGANKHKTEIADGVFVGSNSSLVAPISIAENVTIGAGSTLSNSVNDECLIVVRAKARLINNWKRPVKAAK